MNGKRIVVLGGAGFIGSHLCERLLSDGAESVVSVDNQCTGRAGNLIKLRQDARFLELREDIVEGISVPGRVDFVLNLASPASPVDYARLGIETLRVGSIGTENALRLAEEKEAVFLQASTSEVYGDPAVHPQHEGYFGNVNPIGPRSVYDESKRYAEAMVMAYRRYRGVSVRLARIFNTYGPRMRRDDGRVVPTLIDQALRGEPLTVFGDGKQTRSFCYVSDLVDGLVRLAQSDFEEPVNLGNPHEMTILEFAEAVRSAIGRTCAIEYRPFPQDDPKQRRPDIRRAREILGWEPKVAFEEGLHKTLEYFRQVDGAFTPLEAAAI